MGASQSIENNDTHAREDEEDEEEVKEGEEEEDESGPTRNRALKLLKKVLQQEPEILPCRASATPLSPQPSNVGTPHLGPSIKVWDPYNVLSAAPPPLPSLPPARSTSPGITQVYLIAHGECESALRPDLVCGRCPSAMLTMVGDRQARALAVLLKSQGVRFNMVYSSPLERCRATAVSVCTELNLPLEQIQPSDALVEMSYGQWEGCLHSEIYTPEMVNSIDKLQPDFCAPSGESLRQVEFRMVEFLNSITSIPQEKLSRSGSHLDNMKGTMQNIGPHGHWDPQSKLTGPTRKRSGKSRFHAMTLGANDKEECSPRDVDDEAVAMGNASSSFACIGIFSHPTPIKCLLAGLLGCSPALVHRFCIDDSSTTVLQHSLGTGWQLKRLNDTSHLRLL